MCQSESTLLKLADDWRRAFDSNEYVAAMDLSRAFDSLPQFSALFCSTSLLMIYFLFQINLLCITMLMIILCLIPMTILVFSSTTCNMTVRQFYVGLKTRALLRLVWPASRLTRTPLARRRWKRLIHQRDVTI